MMFSCTRMARSTSPRRRSEIAQREVRFDRVVVDIDHAQEHFQRLVRFLVEQEAQATEIFFGKFVRLGSQERSWCRIDNGRTASRQPRRRTARRSAVKRRRVSRHFPGRGDGLRARCSARRKARRSRPRSLSSSATQ